MPTQNPTLARKPLVEAIFELRWELEERQPGFKSDPNYKILLGRLFDRLQTTFSYHEPLPTAQLPDELVAGIVQHRFRTEKDSWPLVQLGAGLLTFNATTDYSWQTYRVELLKVLEQFYSAYPSSGNLRVSSLTLRYINALAMQDSDDILTLFEQLKISISIPKSLFQVSGMQPTAKTCSLEAIFPSGNHIGNLALKIGTGMSGVQKSLVWETACAISDAPIPQGPAEVEQWLEGAHDVTSAWFFGMIEGDLRRQFD